MSGKIKAGFGTLIGNTPEREFCEFIFERTLSFQTLYL